MVEITGMQIEVVGVYRERGVFELDGDFHAFALGTRGEVQQRMFVKAELGEDAVQARGGCFGHREL